MLQDKGSEISDHILQEVETRFKNVNQMKQQTLEKKSVSVTPIALRNTPRGDKI